MAVARPEPGKGGGAEDAGERADRQMHGLAQLHQQQRGFHSLAADHQQREEEYAEERAAARSCARLPQMPFNVAFHAASGTPHMDDHPEDGHGRDDGERTVEPFLVGGMEKQPAAEGAHAERNGNAPVHRGSQLSAARLTEVGKADGDDEEGLEPFAKSDDERLKHVQLETETQSQDVGSVYRAISDRSSRQCEKGDGSRFDTISIVRRSHGLFSFSARFAL